MSPAKERIQTLNANPGVGGTRIARDKYEAMKRALLEVIPYGERGVPFKELSRRVAQRLPEEVFPPEASVTWYTVVVKLDLEARGLIERVPGARPQRVRRVRGGRAASKS